MANPPQPPNSDRAQAYSMQFLKVSNPPLPDSGAVTLYVDAATGKVAAIDSSNANAMPSGTGTPGGTDKAIQFNNNGVFGGNVTAMSFDGSSVEFTASGSGAIICAGIGNTSGVLLQGGNTGNALVSVHYQNANTIDIINGESGKAINLSGAISLGQASDTIGFFATTPIGKPTVSGSRGGNAALASLLTALANLGLIINNSS